jgi:hypothetical protein
MKKYSILLLCILGITSINASQDASCFKPEPKKCEVPTPPPPPCCETPKKPTIAAYNQSAIIDVCGSWDFFITGTFLWIQPIEEQLEFALTSYNNAVTSVGKIHKLDFDWKPAFKVGCGKNFNHDNWDAYFQYTRIKTSMSSSAKKGNTPNEELRDMWLNQAVLANTTEVKENWKLKFNIIDFELARAFYNGKKLVFRPYYGLKGGWINQSINITDTQTTGNITGSFKSKSWLIGPRIGVNSQWQAGCGFRINGNAAASLFYQQFHKLEKREPYINNPTLWYTYSGAINHSITNINASLEGLFGIGYGTYFYRNNYHFDIDIGYEIQLFLDQNMLRYIQQFSNYNNNNVSKAGNLLFHGLNITVRFDF